MKSLTDLELVPDNYDEIIARLGIRVQEKADAGTEWQGMQESAENQPARAEESKGVEPKPAPKRRAPRKKVAV